jgi:hypothetical protein
MVSRHAIAICQYTLFYWPRKIKTSPILLKSSPPLPKAWTGCAASSVDRSGECGFRKCLQAVRGFWLIPSTNPRF